MESVVDVIACGAGCIDVLGNVIGYALAFPHEGMVIEVIQPYALVDPVYGGRVSFCRARKPVCQKGQELGVAVVCWVQEFRPILGVGLTAGMWRGRNDRKVVLLASFSAADNIASPAIAVGTRIAEVCPVERKPKVTRVA